MYIFLSEMLLLKTIQELNLLSAWLNLMSNEFGLIKLVKIIIYGLNNNHKIKIYEEQINGTNITNKKSENYISD